MSNILIIKHGSLGDIAQISGVLKDIKEHHKSDKVLILTTLPYVELLNNCPHIDGVIIDRRLPRWNIFYLFKLKKTLKRFNFTHVYDLQNSSRTSFYRRFLLNIKNWSSTETTIKKGEKKKDFNNESVLNRFKKQLDSSNIKTDYTLKPDFSWAITNIDKIVNQYFGKKLLYIEKPEALSKSDYNLIHKDISKKVLSTNNEKWQTIPRVYSEIDTLRAKFAKQDEPDKLKMLDEINAYVEELEKHYSSA